MANFALKEVVKNITRWRCFSGVFCGAGVMIFTVQVSISWCCRASEQVTSSFIGGQELTHVRGSVIGEVFAICGQNAAQLAGFQAGNIFQVAHQGAMIAAISFGELLRKKVKMLQFTRFKLYAYIARVRVHGAVINDIRSPWASNEIARVNIVIMPLVVQFTESI